MKILFVSEKFPYPLDTGGNVRTFNLLKGLSLKHEITLLTPLSGEINKTCIDAISELCRIHFVKVKPTNKLFDILKFARSLFSRTPFVISKHFHFAIQEEIRLFFREKKPKNMPEKLEDQSSSFSFDVVHMNHLDAAIYTDVIPKEVIKVLDEHNVVTNQINTIMKTEHQIIKKMIFKYEYWKLKNYEKNICNKMNLCLACSEKDRDGLKQIGVKSKIAVIPNGVDLDYFNFELPTDLGNKELVFVGTLDYDPCEKGVYYFCDQILPLIKNEIPDVRFIVIGRNPSKRLQAIAGFHGNIILTGRVEDIRPLVHKAKVFVVPLLSGSGTRLKILEAMAMGLPVVTTSIGMEGIEAINGEHLWIADSSTEFAKVSVKMLCNFNETELMGKKARILVENLYGWKKISQNLLNEYEILT